MGYFNFSLFKYRFQHSFSTLQNQSDLLPQIMLHNGKKKRKKNLGKKKASPICACTEIKRLPLPYLWKNST